MRRTRVFVAIPTTGTVCDAQAHCLREIEKRYADEIEFVWPKWCVRRIFHDCARNAMAEEFLESNADIIWYLDSDISPARHVLDLITLHGDKWQVAGAAYPVLMCPEEKDKPQIVFTVYNGTNGTGLHPSKCSFEGTEFVDGLATGCLFIKREVFGLLKKPYFEFKYDAESRAIAVGEDIGFCRKMMDLGIKFFTDYSMVCKHYKTVCLLDLNNYAIEYANKAVKAYDGMIKGQVAELAAKITMKKQSSLILPNKGNSVFKL